MTQEQLLSLSDEKRKIILEKRQELGSDVIDYGDSFNSGKFFFLSKKIYLFTIMFRTMLMVKSLF